MNIVYIKSNDDKPLCTLKFIQPPITVEQLLNRAYQKLDKKLNVNELCLRPILWSELYVLNPTDLVPLHLCNEYILETKKNTELYRSVKDPDESFPWLFYMITIIIIYCWYKYVYL